MACKATMGDIFDKMTKSLATGVTRRDAFKYVGAGVLGTMLANLGVSKAEAARCSGALACGSCPPTDCTPPDNGGQCLCLRKFKDGVCASELKAKCVQNALCSTLISCTRTGRDCKKVLGQNWKCTDGACCGVVGVCTALCGTVPPCCSAQGGGASLASKN